MTMRGNGVVGRRVGAYLIHRLLGRGGFADIWLGKHLASGQQVAIKIASARYLPYETRTWPRWPVRRWAQVVERATFLDPKHPGWQWPTLDVWDVNEMLEREAEALAAIRDPRFVRVLETGSYYGLFYLVLEYVEGPSLRQLMDSEAAIPFAWFLELCDALMAAEHEGLRYHGDLKPDNVLITPDGSLKLLDPSSPLTRHGKTERLVTTPAYNPFLVASDLPAFGSMLYELMTGFLPFSESLLEPTRSMLPGKTPADELASRFVPARYLNSEIPALLDQVMAWALGLREEGASITAARRSRSSCAA